MAILVVLLVIWRLHSRPQQFGGMGGWIGSNVLGSGTLSLLPGSETGTTNGNGEQTNAPIQGYTQAGPSNTAPVAAAPPRSNQAPATNLVNTNAPPTAIAVTPADLAETPAGVTTASNIPDAAAIERRLGEVSAKGGDIQISLYWKNFNDLDLHCIDPSGEEIWFNNKISYNTHGELDVDQNAQPPYNAKPVENIFWPVGGAPRGRYQVFVVYYAQHDAANATAFTVRTVMHGRTNFFSSIISYTGQRERKPVCTLQY